MVNAVQEGDCPDKQSDEALARAGGGRATRTRSLVWFTGICPWCWGWPPVIAGRGWNRRTWPRRGCSACFPPSDLSAGRYGVFRHLCVGLRAGTGLSPLSNGPDRSGMSRPPPWKAGTTGTSRDCRMDKPIQSGCFWRGKRPPACGRGEAVLTELEYQVLMLYLSAYSYEEIAARLHVGAKRWITPCSVCAESWTPASGGSSVKIIRIISASYTPL